MYQDNEITDWSLRSETINLIAEAYEYSRRDNDKALNKLVEAKKKIDNKNIKNESQKYLLESIEYLRNND